MNEALREDAEGLSISDEEMEKELIASMKRNYQRHLNEEAKTGFKYTQWQAEKLKELKRYQRENQNIIGSYTNNLSKEIAEHMQEELKQGSINAIKQYNKVLKSENESLKNEIKELRRNLAYLNTRVNNIIAEKQLQEKKYLIHEI